MNSIPTSRELAEEMKRVFREAPMTPRETWEFLIQQGIIDRNGRVLVNRYFPTDAPEEANCTPPSSDATHKE
jgi:hypothetical protein